MDREALLGWGTERIFVGVSTHLFMLTTPMLALFLVVLILLVAAVVVVFRRRYLWATTLFAASLIGSGVFLMRTVLAEPQSWAVMLAAVSNADPALSQARAEDLRPYWDTHQDEILLKDWLMLANRWGVCHELWQQTDCIVAPGPREPLGIAREILGDIARGVRLPHAAR